MDVQGAAFANFWDDLSLWAAPFGMALLNHVPIGRAVTILDVGAGTGFSTIELAQRCGTDSRVIAVDPWAAANERLRSKVAFHGLHNVEVIEEDVTKLDLPAASVDLIVSNLGINNFEDPSAVLRVCRRLLRHDGYIALTTNFRGHMHEFYDVFRDAINAAGMQDRLAALDDHIAHRGTFAALVESLNQADFDVVDHHADVFRMRYADGTAFLRHSFVRTAFLPAWRGVVPANRADEVFDAIEQRLNGLARQYGEWVVTVPVDYVGAKPRAVA